MAPVLCISRLSVPLWCQRTRARLSADEIGAPFGTTLQCEQCFRALSFHRTTDAYSNRKSRRVIRWQRHPGLTRLTARSRNSKRETCRLTTIALLGACCVSFCHVHRLFTSSSVHRVLFQQSVPPTRPPLPTPSDYRRLYTQPALLAHTLYSHVITHNEHSIDG